MSGRLFAFHHPTLTELSRRALRVLTGADVPGWRDLWREHGQAIMNWGCPNEWSEAAVPVAEPRGLDYSLRLIAFASALRRAELWEKAWHVRYPDLSDDEAGFPVSESEAYEAVGLHVFATGPIPEEFDFLDESGVVTNWISPPSVARLWSLEQGEAFLATVGATLSAHGAPLGHDLLAVRSMLEFSHQYGASVYLWDPGT